MPGAFSAKKLGRFSKLRFMETTGNIQQGSATKNSASREIYADLLRVFAAFTVVFQHTVTSVWYTVPVDSSDFAALNFLNSLSRFGVGVFIMISGAFMLSPKYPHPPEKILKHNLPRTLIPLVFWVIFYGVVEQINVNIVDGSFAAGDIAGIVTDVLSAPLLLFTKPAGHLWFLYTIVGLYLLTPPLRVFTEHASRKMVLYVITLFFAFGLFLPTVNHLLKTFAGFTLYKNIGIQGVTSFAGFYLTGFYLSHFGVGATARKAMYGAALASWIVAFVAATYISDLHNTPNEYFFGNFRPTTYLMAAGIFAAMRATFSKDPRDEHTQEQPQEKPQKQSIILQKVTTIALKFSGCMMGVYLIHPLFIKAFYGLHLTILEPHPIVTAPLAAIAFYILATALVYVFRKVSGIRKVL